MGSSGQNLDDIYKYVDSEDRLAMAEANLKWGHLAPTAPDTLCTLSTFFLIVLATRLTETCDLCRVLSV